MAENNFQQLIMRELKRLVGPAMRAQSNPSARDEFFLLLGWDLKEIDQINTASSGDINSKLGALVATYTTITNWVNNPPETITDLLSALDDAQSLFNLLKDLQNTSNPLSLQDFNKLGTEVSELLITLYLDTYYPVLFNLLALLGLIEPATEQTPAGKLENPASSVNYIVRRNYRVHKLHLDKIVPLLSDTKNYFQQEYLLPVNANWANANAAKATANKLFGRISEFLSTLGIKNQYGNYSYPGLTLDADNVKIIDQSLILVFNSFETGVEFGLTVSLSDANSGDLGVVFSPFGTLNFTQNLGSWAADLALSSAITAFSIKQGDFTFPNGFSNDRIGASLNLRKLPTSDGSAFLIGSTTGSYLRVEQFEVEGSLELSSVLREYGVSVTMKDASFLISPGDGDGFLQKILPTNGLQGEFDLKLMWDNLSGFHFEGAGSMELLIPIHKTILNALTIDSMVVAAKIDTQIKIIAAMSGNLKLGPFNAVFQEVGLAFDFDFPADKDGNLGALDVGVGFKPPKGLGLSIKEKTISGGGFLSFNKDEGRYVGALELSIKKKIAIKAIGILTTKLPGGQPGYSLLLLITAEFQPIQLGFGFTLNGVGGLIALHRRMNTDELLRGVSTGTIDNILFPTDPVANINSIVSSLEKTFPIAEGRYTFGPMAIIGWGTPTLITAELGLFFELPNTTEIALIGVIRAILPKEDNPILKLQIAFAGIINFEKKSITFNASLFDSSVAGMGLSGDMIFRLRWGDQPTFVLSVGGFHPKFPIPPLNIPDMNRLTINLLGGDRPRLTLSTYFAITSNTAQFGAAIDFYWEITDKIDINGHLGFDALFYFSPFRFVATMEGSLEVRRKNKAMLSIWFAGLLEGPTPWHVQGSVGFKILGINYERDFDKTFGRHDYAALPDVQVLPKLVAALQDKKNWQATMSDVPLLVTIRELNVPGGDLVVHPQGTLAVSQKVVPLNIGISRFGNCRPDPVGYSYFSLEISYSSSSSAPALPKTDLKEFFSPNEYFDLSEDDRLNRPSFEPFTAGAQVTTTSTALTTGGYREMEYLYETTIMDDRRYPIRIPTYTTITSAMRTGFSGGNAASNSPLAVASKIRGMDAPSPVATSGRSFAIAQTSDLSAYGLSAGSYTEALALLEQEIEINPALEGTLQIVNTFELV
jgi:hypothetical protein